ncbi:ThuA domain-containing protein [Flagellimonas onchidii]|uniref:ThuA domain-containing protein n=1 Tax=Flagellimonas onchidii TaxID=2562684 RepID=UPI0010A5DBE0|nr:ThuA domain-containing protein [Allomuricauda onchidii]
MKIILIAVIQLVVLTNSVHAQFGQTKVLNFMGDNGYQHDSKPEAQQMIEELGQKHGWEVTSTSDPSVFSIKQLFSYDVVIFNNNCGTDGAILKKDEQAAFQQYIRNGGGFAGIHCAGAIWHEGGQFQQWYEKLIGTRLVTHPHVQPATLTVDNPKHPITNHLPHAWAVTDEWHQFGYSPRESVNVLLTLDENSYRGNEKMNGDHPFTWYQHYDGGRSFFTSLGHTKGIYADDNFRKLIAKGIQWAAEKSWEYLPITQGLLLDLDADQNIQLEDGNKIKAWTNNAPDDKIGAFYKQDEGRVVKGSGRPRLVLNHPAINGHNTVVFHRQELVNDKEDGFDHLMKGSGYTWAAIMAVYEQIPDLPGVSSFFGNLRNSNLDGKGKYEGFWAGLSDDNHLWMSTRNAITFGRWDENNPYLVSPEPLEEGRYYLVMGRLAPGTGTVTSELFLNNSLPIDNQPYPSNLDVDPSKMVIGQERDATNHPGKESFDGEIARFLIYERSLSNEELEKLAQHLIQKYNLNNR